MNWLKDISLTIEENLSSLRNLVSKLSVHKKNDTKVLTINPFVLLTIASHNFLLTESVDFRCCWSAVIREGFEFKMNLSHY